MEACIFAFYSLTIGHAASVSELAISRSQLFYFTSVEQELRPELRGCPVAVVAVAADTTCCIAVSYEARSYGLRTGVSVKEARRLCPNIQLVESRPKLYVEMHHRILGAIERCIPVHTVLSCDEFSCRLMGSQCRVERATELASEIKQSIRQHAGKTLRCSVGLGPSRLLAKIAGEMQKPDGLMALIAEDLPHALYCLAPHDIPGVGRRMEKRLEKEGIKTVPQLCALSRERMASLWGGVLGERMWLELRGEDLPEQEVKHPLQTISRQHILPPDKRTHEGCRQVALKMLHDCVRKLRRLNLWAGGVGVSIYHLHHDYAFQADCRVPACQDGITLQEHFLALLAGAPNHTPQAVVVYLLHLETSPALNLFPSAQSDKRDAVAKAMESVQNRFGREAVYLASLHGAHESAPQRISFGPPPPLVDFED